MAERRYALSLLDSRSRQNSVELWVPAGRIMSPMLVKCADCDTMFDPRPSGRGPSRRRCAVHRAQRKKELIRARTAVRRAEQWGVEVDTVIASAVFERDNWTCHICGREIPDHLRTVRTLLGE